MQTITMTKNQSEELAARFGGSFFQIFLDARQGVTRSITHAHTPLSAYDLQVYDAWLLRERSSEAWESDETTEEMSPVAAPAHDMSLWSDVANAALWGVASLAIGAGLVVFFAAVLP